MKKLEDIIEETWPWNNGNGIDVDAWISNEGNYNLALGYSTIFWPEFVKVKGYILYKGVQEKNILAFEQGEGSTKKSVECVLNHIHIEDLHNHENDKATSEKLIRLGGLLKEIYEAKLAWQFPDSPCEVSFFIPENQEELCDYVLTFWQVKHG